MEKELADIEAQEEKVALAKTRYDFSIQEAARMHAEAEQMIKDARTAWGAELLKLEKCKQLASAVKSADMFTDGKKVTFANKDLGKKSYTTHTMDGKPVRFAVKHVVYPLEVQDNKLVGLQKPREGQRVESIKGYIGHTPRGNTTILETDVYELLKDVEITRGGKSLFPIDGEWIRRWDNVLVGEYKEQFIMCGRAATYTYDGPYPYRRTLQSPAVVTGGYISVHVAYRTDLKRKKTATVAATTATTESDSE